MLQGGCAILPIRVAVMCTLCIMGSCVVLKKWDAFSDQTRPFFPFVNDCVHCSHRKICTILQPVALIIQDQAFYALSVHRNDCCGLGAIMAGIVTDGRTAIFEMFTPLKCFTASERLIAVLCLKSPVKMSVGFMALFTKDIITHCSMHTLTLSSAILINGLWTGPQHVCCLSVNRTHLPLTTPCTTATLASLFIPVKLKVLV